MRRAAGRPFYTCMPHRASLPVTSYLGRLCCWLTAPAACVFVSANRASLQVAHLLNTYRIMQADLGVLP